VVLLACRGLSGAHLQQALGIRTRCVELGLEGGARLSELHCQIGSEVRDEIKLLLPRCRLYPAQRGREARGSHVPAAAFPTVRAVLDCRCVVSLHSTAELECELLGMLEIDSDRRCEHARRTHTLQPSKLLECRSVQWRRGVRRQLLFPVTTIRFAG
jgi:hypothetical protein